MEQVLLPPHSAFSLVATTLLWLHDLGVLFGALEQTARPILPNPATAMPPDLTLKVI
jgi:hypothetical protein